MFKIAFGSFCLLFLLPVAGCVYKGVLDRQHENRMGEIRSNCDPLQIYPLKPPTGD